MKKKHRSHYHKAIAEMARYYEGKTWVRVGMTIALYASRYPIEYTKDIKMPIVEIMHEFS